MAQTRWSDFAAVDDDPQPIDWSEFEAVEAPPPKPAPSRGGYLTEIARGLTMGVPAAAKTASVISENQIPGIPDLPTPVKRRIMDFAFRTLGVDAQPDAVPEARPLYKLGQKMQDKLDAAYPAVSEPDRNIGHDVAKGVGQVVSMVGPALGARALGASVGGAAVLGTALGFSTEFDDAFNRARQRGDDPDTAFAKSLGYATVASLIENRFGAGRIIKKYFPDPAEAAKKLSAWGVSKATAVSLAVGFGEEGSQRFAQNWIVEGKPSLEGIVEEGAPGGIVQAIAELPAHLLRGRGGRIRSSLPRPERKPDEKTTRPIIPEAGEEAAVRQPPPDQEVLGSQEGQSQKQLGLRRVVAGDTEPKKTAAAPAQEEASLIVASELGLTVEPAMNLEGVDPEVAAKIPPMVRFTDTRKPGESPTASLSFSVPANASREQIITEFERAKKGFVPPVIPPGNAPQGPAPVAGGPAVISGGQPPAAGAAKQPWKMTKAEWRTHEQRGTWADFQDEPLREARAKEAASRAEIKTAEDARKELGQVEQIRKVMTDKAGALQRNQARRDADKATQSAREQFNRSSARAGRMATHEAFIERAQDRGESIPPEVKADYPDLKPPAAPAAVTAVVPPEQSGTSTATGEKRVVRGLRARKIFDSETEANGPDILSWMAENFRMMSKSTARQTKGKEWWQKNQSLYDDSAPLETPTHGVIYGGNSMPDQVAQAAYEAGVLKSPDANELWAVIKSASKRRAGLAGRLKIEQALLESEAAEQLAWQKATEKGAVRVVGEQLKVGDVMDVEGERTEVVAVDPESGDATLKDGKRFGSQTVGSGQVIYVEKFDESESSDDFAPPEQPATVQRPLTEAEQSEFQSLSIKARAAREAGGAQFTGIELRRYQDLEKLAGAQDLPLETGKQFKPAGDLSLSGETAVEKPPEKAAMPEQDLFGTYTAKAEELAQRLEKLKRQSPGGTQMVFFPGLDPASARALWNTAIDAAQVVLRATGRIADAIDAAIQAIRQAYQGEFDEAAARAELTTEIGDEPPPQPPQPPTSEEQVFLNSPSFQENAALADEIGMRTPAEDEEGVPTKVGDVEDMVRTRPGLNAAVREDSVANAENALREAGLNVERADDGLFRLADTFTQQEQEGQRLVTILEREIQSSRAENRPERIANLLNTVVVHLARDQNQAFSQALKNKLYSLAQGERSAFGRALGGLAMWGRVLANVAQNLDLNLGRLYSNFMGGEQITPVMEKLMTVFRSYFTPEEIQAALNPLDIPATVDRLIQLNQRDSGSRVYRQVHARLKAKVPKTQEQKNRKALEDEAIEAMIRRAAELGQVEPKKLPNQKLTPDEQLALVSQPAVAAKIQQAIEEAIRQAEFNAGWKAEENAARGNAEALADIAERKAVGEEPSDEMIEAGLQLKEYAHWNVLRDALLSYSPTTVKLVEDVINGRFKGARFKPLVAKPEDFRIDFKQLAVSPEAEVQRVFDAQLAQVEGLMQGATPATVERVTRMFQEKITQQLEQRRREVVDYMFAEQATGKEKPTAIEAIKKQINAGLLRDQRLSDTELLELAASKSAIRNLLPNSTTLINRILDSPRYKLEDIKADIAAALVKELGLTDPQAQELSALIYKSLDGTEAKPGPLRTAARKALEKVQTELSPADKKVFFKEGKRGTKDARGIKQGRTLWDKLERAVKAGLFDPGDVLQEMAREQGWTIPTPAQKAQLKEWVEEESRLRTPTQRQIDKFNGDVEKATAEAEAGTEGERIALIRNIQSNWSRWSMPVSFVNWFSGNAQIARNNAKAINEFVGANLLLKFGFAVRQMMDVGVVSMPLNAINRALAHVMERAQNDGGFSAETIKDLDSATREMVVSRIASITATLRNMERTLTGHTNRKVLDRMSHSVGVFERMSAKADELESKGNLAGARAVRLATILQAGYRIAAVWDSAQSTGLEWQEMRQQLATDLRKTGATRAEIATKLDDIFGGLKVDLLAATEEARLIGTERGLEKDNATLQQDAWNLIKASAYDRMRAAAGTETNYKAENEQLRELHSWNLPETGGLGGVIAETIKAVRSRTEKVGIPTGGLFSFGNAMGIAANRIVTFSGGGLFGGFGFGDSPWYQGQRNVQQRRIEAVQGLAAIGILVALAAAGKILVQIKYPEDKDEKEKFIAEGHKLNTVKFMADDGDWVEYPIQMSPFSFIAAPLYMIGGMQQLLTNKHREQERLNAEAAKTGTTPGTAKPIGAKDAVGVIAQGIYGLLTGGRTASGAVQSFSDYGDFNLNKAASRVVTPYVPGLPAWQEASRAMGVAMDTRTATMLELLVPSPWSGHQRVNSLGDPLVNPNDFSRVVQVATGGIGWGSESDLKDSHAYQQIFAAGYSTPDVGRNKGYNFDGTIRPMTPQELETYTVTRGKNFKQELDAVDVTGLPEKEAHRVVQQAFQRANARALSEIGVYAPPRASTPRAVTPIVSSVPRVRSGRVRSSLGGGRTRSTRTRLATMKVPRLKRGRVRGSMRRRGRIRSSIGRRRPSRIYA